MEDASEIAVSRVITPTRRAFLSAANHRRRANNARGGNYCPVPCCGKEKAHPRRIHQEYLHTPSVWLLGRGVIVILQERSCVTNY